MRVGPRTALVLLGRQVATDYTTVRKKDGKHDDAELQEVVEQRKA